MGCRLLEKPWAKLEPVRDFLAARVGHAGEPERILGFVCTAKIERPPVLSVYVYLHLYDELAANPFPPMAVLPAEGEEELILTLEAVYLCFEILLQRKYVECPSVFQDFLCARVEGAFARCTASM